MEKIIQNLKKSTKWRQSLIEYGTATILISIVVWFIVTRNTTDNEIRGEVKMTNITVKRLQSQIDTVMMYQDLLIQKAASLEVSQDENKKILERYNVLLLQNRIAIEKIRIENNEKINNASGYGYGELDSFFTNRYKGY